MVEYDVATYSGSLAGRMDVTCLPRVHHSWLAHTLPVHARMGPS